MVRAALQTAAGFVWELTVPRGPDGRVKGFAFAAFTCLAHAQRAITNVNGKVRAASTSCMHVLIWDIGYRLCHMYSHALGYPRSD